MDEDRNHERSGSMSLGAPPSADDVSPINGESATTAPTAPPPTQAQVQASADPNAKVVHDVINSEVRVYRATSAGIRELIRAY